MEAMTLKDLIYQLGGAEKAAQMLAARSGRPLGAKAIYKWNKRELLPARWVLPLYECAKSRRIRVSLEAIARLSLPAEHRKAA